MPQEHLSDQDREDRQAYPQADSDSEPPLQQGEILNKHLMIKHFQPILETLADLDRDVQKLAFQAARPAALLRHLWALLGQKHPKGEIPDENDRAPKEATTKLSKERVCFQLRPDEQLPRLVSLELALVQTQEWLISVLKDF